MIVLRYQKIGAMRYISHIDLLRAIERTVRRAGVEVGFSGGYNPHMQLNLGITLPLGVGSTAEYVAIDTPVHKDEFLLRYQAVQHPCLPAVNVYEVPKNPNLAGKVCMATYRVPFSGSLNAAACEQVLSRENWVVSYPTKKDAAGTRDIRPLIHSLLVEANTIVVCMAAGNTSVKPEYFADALERELGISVLRDEIVRVCQYLLADGKLLNADDYLRSMEE